MISRKVTVTVYAGTLLKVLLFSPFLCSGNSILNTTLAESGTAVSVPSAARSLKTEEAKTQLLDQFEALLCDTQKTRQSLECEGFRFQKTGQIEAAIDKYKAALAIAQKDQDIHKTALLFLLLGGAHTRPGQLETAAWYYREASILFGKSGDTPWVVASLYHLGDVLLVLGQSENALSTYLAVFGIAVEKNNLQLGKKTDSEFAVALVSKTAATALQLEKYEEAIEVLDTAAETFKRNNDLKLNAQEYYWVAGNIYREKLKNNPGALDSYSKALELGQVERDSSAKCEMNYQLGSLHYEMKDYENALSVLEPAVDVCKTAKNPNRRAKGIFQEMGERASELSTLVLLAQAYMNLGQFQDAFLSSQKVQEIARGLQNTEMEAAAFLTLATLADVLGDTDHVHEYFLQALMLYQQNGNLQQEAFILAELGRLQQDMSKYDEALAFYHRAREKYRQAKDQKREGEMIASVAEVYRWIGDNENALRWYQSALETSREMHNIAGETHALTKLGLIHAFLGNEEVLKELNLQLVKTAQELHDRIRPKVQERNIASDDVLAYMRMNQVVGEIQARWGDPTQAISILSPILQIYKQLPRTREYLKETAVSLYFLGYAYSQQHQYEEAIEALQQSANIAQRLNSSERYWVLNRMGFVREQQGKLQEALDLYIQATEILEQVSFRQRPEEIRIPVREVAFYVYQNILRILYKLYIQTHEQRYIEQAFFYYEKGKARVLLDFLVDVGVHLRQGLDPALQKEEEQITARLSGLHRALAKPDLPKEQERALLETLVEQQRALQVLQVKVAVTNPKYADLTSPQVVDLNQVQAILDQETLLLEYVLTEEQSFLWAVTQDGMHGYELPVESEISQQIEHYLSTLRTPLFGRDEIKRHVELGRKLYSTLLQPVSSQLQEKNRLIIVPDSSLYYLPFEALIAGDGKGSRDGRESDLQSLPYVVKNHTVTYTPSASVLVSLEKNRNTSHKEPVPQEPLLAFGDPLYESAPKPRTVAFNLRGDYEERNGGFARLAYSGEEIEKIAEIYGVPLFSLSVNLREKATEKHLRELNLSRYRILHFATHAILRDEVKWITQPALVLSLNGVDDTHDGFLQMDEIFNLRLNADLVVLSACDTGRGKLHRGEGVVGLTRAFMYAGTPSVVASLWKVYDHSTSRFMEFFYRNLKAGHSKAEALRQAKIQLIQTRVQSEALGGEQSLAAPYFWAPFVLVGRGN